jgi:hypothetical protein
MIAFSSGCGGGGGAGDDNVNNSAPVPGKSAEGWVSDYADESATCDSSEEELSHLAHVGFEDTTIYVGYEQVSSNNQDPIVVRFDGGELVYCRYHETEGPDGRAVGITWDGGEAAYIVYTVVGGGTSFESKGGWLNSYAPGAISGGGPKVSYVGKINAENGDLVSGTFIIAVKSDNKVNTHSPVGPVTVLENGEVEFLGESAHKPIDADGKNAMDCTEYPFGSRYRFSSDLTSLVCADCTNCISEKPCE